MALYGVNVKMKDGEGLVGFEFSVNEIVCPVVFTVSVNLYVIVIVVNVVSAVEYCFVNLLENALIPDSRNVRDIIINNEVASKLVEYHELIFIQCLERYCFLHAGGTGEWRLRMRLMIIITLFIKFLAFAMGPFNTGISRACVTGKGILSVSDIFVADGAWKLRDHLRH